MKLQLSIIVLRISGNKVFKFETKMILQVHDELVFDVPKNELAQVTPVIKKAMETAKLLEVPVVVESGSGMNWLEAH